MIQIEEITYSINQNNILSVDLDLKNIGLIDINTLRLQVDDGEYLSELVEDHFLRPDESLTIDLSRKHYKDFFFLNIWADDVLLTNAYYEINSDSNLTSSKNQAGSMIPILVGAVLVIVGLGGILFTRKKDN